MCEKDYNLLRPFDLEAAKRGDAILWIGEPATFVGRSRSGNTNIIECESMRVGSVYQVHYAQDGYLRMAPLCWVDGRPVYKGDVLWHNRRGRIVASHMIDDGEFLCEEGVDSGDRPENLTWTPPKVKREGWINIYKGVDTNEYVSGDIHKTKHLADMRLASKDRIACIHIEWEE